MKHLLSQLLLTVLICTSQTAFAKPVVNVYVWGGEIPKSVVRQFEKETGIKVNFSTYDSNEVMYAKLKASRKTVYDVVMPSGYFVERMRSQGMLSKLDHNQLPNLKNIDPWFTQSQYDPANQFSVPVNWGATGIFYNKKWIKPPPLSWKSLWNSRWRGQLMLLDDAREVFSIALLKLGYEPNDKNPEHIKQAYGELLKLVPNIKLFASDSVQAIIIDGDALAGSAWNGDAFKARQENQAIQFVYPQEGFVIWVDCLAIPKHAPHLKEAYAFINFILKPESAKEIALEEGHATTNANGKKLLPAAIRDNPMVYPGEQVLQKAFIQRDVGQNIIELYNNYWQKLKLSF